MPLPDVEEGGAGGTARIPCVTTAGGSSFSPATLVLLASGTAVPISRLKPGDKVLATSTRTGKTSLEPVTAVLVHHDTDLYNLTVKTAHGTGVIHTTSSHLYWAPYHHRWVPANKLSKGEHLKSSGGATVTVVGGSTPKDHEGWMWDITVPGNNDHDFYVVLDGQGRSLAVVGAIAVLVHNAGCGPDLGPSWKPLPSSGIPCSTGCENVAAQIQKNIGGEIVTIKPADGYAGLQLGPYRGQDSGWYTHTVVVNDGRVFDAFSSRTGVPVAEYKKLWEYADVINFGF